MASDDKYSEEEKNINFTWDLTNLWVSFKEDTEKEMSVLVKEISLAKKEFSTILELLNSKTEEIKTALEIFSDAKETIDDEKSELIEAVDILKQLEGKTVTINTPDLDYIIQSMASIVGEEAEETIKSVIENDDIKKKFTSVFNIARKVEHQLDTTNKGMLELLDYCEKGTDSIYTSEVIILKLMSVLRFLDKLSDKDREKILNSNLVVLEDVAKKMEIALTSDAPLLVSPCKADIKSIPQKQMDMIESKLEKFEVRLNRMESNFEEKTNQILEALTKNSSLRENKKPLVEKQEKVKKEVSQKKEIVNPKPKNSEPKEDRKKQAKKLMSEMFTDKSGKVSEEDE